MSLCRTKGGSATNIQPRAVSTKASPNACLAERSDRLGRDDPDRPVAAIDPPRVAARAGDPGDPQSEEGASWAGHFEDDDYVRIDWSRPARAIHNQVRAWHLTFGMSGLRAPLGELDGEDVVVLQTRLTDPGGDARRVDCGDGPIWVVATEPV